MRTLSITLNVCLQLLLTLPVGANAQEQRRDRLIGLLTVAGTIEQLDKYGHPKAVFMSYKDTDITSATFGLELCVLEAPRGTSRLRVKDIRVDDNPREVFQSLIPATSLGVMTGGFFGLDRHGAPIPLGLVRSDYKTISPRHPWKTGGVVVTSAKGVEIISIARFTNSQGYSDAIQSKPILVEKGKDGIRSATNDRFDRSAVGIDSGGSVYFFVIHEPAGNAASLAEFSSLLRAFRSTRGKLIVSALAMDGGPGAHLYIPPLKKHCGSGTPNFVPNVLYLAK